MFRKMVLIILFISALSPLCFADMGITQIDRNKLYANYQIPKYVFPAKKIEGLQFNDAVKFLKEDIYNYAKLVEQDYMKEVQAPISLFVPQVVREKVNKSVDLQITSEEQLKNPALSQIITEGMKEELKRVHGMNFHPVHIALSDVYIEVAHLKEQVNVLEKKLREKNSEPNYLLYVALGSSLLALIISIGQSSKKNKK